MSTGDSLLRWRASLGVSFIASTRSRNNHSVCTADCYQDRIRISSCVVTLLLNTTWRFNTIWTSFPLRQDTVHPKFTVHIVC
ncbi:MAG: hypothetical protein [Circular genetic element sp.]|nr:MAG: hypothetical protein [Circular genetic element sp.]